MIQRVGRFFSTPVLQAKFDPSRTREARLAHETAKHIGGWLDMGYHASTDWIMALQRVTNLHVTGIWDQETQKAYAYFRDYSSNRAPSL